ncbi:unnamed protein product [Clonostachys rosea f. rosea IK726]|uniref:Uncharacterized protein n=1 Tax=Clonostachys rosea f. rosea IK726 TaxID=1349383 RepID=A0ACA9ULL1_BIOOC|nr:unnamed protein product [Clonostachys rosea f. rosea IK726]
MYRGSHPIGNYAKQDCSKITWADCSDLQVIKPEDDVVAIVVDMPNSSGHIRIYNTESDERIDGVGDEAKKDKVIVVWEGGLKFVCYGACRVGFIRG